MAEGYEIPLHRSLTEPILMAGAPRSAAIAIGTLAAALALGLRLWIPGLLLWVLGHSAAVFMARSDPDFMAVASRSVRNKEQLMQMEAMMASHYRAEALERARQLAEAERGRARTRAFLGSPD